MYNHPLIKVATMLYRVCFAVIQGEYGLSEAPRKSHSLNLARERRLGNLVECFTHGIIS